MNKPEQYILDEWDSLCVKAHKAAQSECPLIEDETLKAMGKYVYELETRINVLEDFLGMIAKGIPNIPQVSESYADMAVHLLRGSPNETSKH